MKLYCGRSGRRSAGTSCQQQKSPRAASTDIYHHPPSALGFFTLHTDLPRELNARTLSETLEHYQQKRKLRLRHLMWALLMLHQSFQNQGSEEILNQYGDVTLLREKFHVTINLSQSQEARKVVSAICIHLNAKHENVHISI